MRCGTCGATWCVHLREMYAAFEKRAVEEAKAAPAEEAKAEKALALGDVPGCRSHVEKLREGDSPRAAGS